MIISGFGHGSVRSWGLTLFLRLNNQLHFSQRDIYNSMRILQIRPDEVGAYFFERPRCEEFYF